MILNIFIFSKFSNYLSLWIKKIYFLELFSIEEAIENDISKLKIVNIINYSKLNEIGNSSISMNLDKSEWKYIPYQAKFRYTK